MDLARPLLTGRGEVTRQRRNEAAAALKTLTATAKKNVYAAHLLGSIYDDGHLKGLIDGEEGPNKATALRWYQFAAKQGFPPAQTDLGIEVSRIGCAHVWSTLTLGCTGSPD